jgi:hypothetical protein
LTGAALSNGLPAAPEGTDDTHPGKMG